MDYETMKSHCDSGLSISDIAKNIGLSKTTVRYYLKKFGLKTRLSLGYVCSCGVSGSENFHLGRSSKCKKCCNSARLDRNHDRRGFAISLLGGSCRSCGYDDYPCSLQIHHTNPDLKDPNFTSLRSWSEERITQELETCVLLCANCHAAFHSGYDIVW